MYRVIQLATHLAVWAILSAGRSEESSAGLGRALVVRLLVLRVVWAMALGRLDRAICLAALGMLLVVLRMALAVCWVVCLVAEVEREEEVVCSVDLPEEAAEEEEGTVVCLVASPEEEEEGMVVCLVDFLAGEEVVVGGTENLRELLKCGIRCWGTMVYGQIVVSL